MKSKFRNTNSGLKSGDLLLTEEPFAFVLSSKEKGSRCDNCLEKVKVLKCSGCQFVHYCGRLCQRDAWNDHKWECANLKRVSPKVIPDAARLLAKIINRLNRGDGHTYKAYYSATSFRMWKDLMSHYPDLKADKKRMEHFTSLCMVLYEFLKDISLPNTVELMGLYGRMIINSFTILDTDMNSIGTGVYLASSIVDHSCNPNAVATFHGKTINITTIKDMPSLDWEQIRISYIDLMKTPYERQMELMENYYFLCQCDRCMDETQLKLVHAAKCLNAQCVNPVNIPWKENTRLVLKPSIEEVANKKSKANENGLDDEEMQNGHHNHQSVLNGDYNDHNNGADSEESADVNIKPEGENVTHCTECGTKYTSKHVETFVKAMEFTEMHLQCMKDASIAYVDVCKYCLEKQEGVLHPLNVMHAQTLDHAFDALIQVQLWRLACQYAEKLIPCFRYYYGEWHPLLGILHLKYGKILLYEMESRKALNQFKCSEKILKTTHGDKHPIYKEYLLPLLTQAMMEAS